jgi:ankyrin repeat protein
MAFERAAVAQIDTALQIPDQCGPHSTMNVTFDVRTAVSALNASNENGSTPLRASTQDEHTEVVKLLFEQGAGVDASNKNGLTPLHAAVQEGHAEMAKLLVEEDHPESALVHQATLKGFNTAVSPSTNNFPGSLSLVSNLGVERCDKRPTTRKILILGFLFPSSHDLVWGPSTVQGCQSRHSRM